MNLGSAISKYLEIAGGFDRWAHLSQFGLPREETETIFSAWDEDYQISRYILLSRERDEALAAYPADRRVFLINGFECSHVSFHTAVQKLL